MASQLASGDLIADRYASAIYDLALENKAVDFMVYAQVRLYRWIKDFWPFSRDMMKSPQGFNLNI